MAKRRKEAVVYYAMLCYRENSTKPAGTLVYNFIAYHANHDMYILPLTPARVDRTLDRSCTCTTDCKIPAALMKTWIQELYRPLSSPHFPKLCDRVCITCASPF